MHTSNLRLIFKPPGQLLELGLNPDVFMYVETHEFVIHIITNVNYNYEKRR